ncbi:hypothetical protein PSTT_08663, partial [Puccinia striiformis]
VPIIYKAAIASKPPPSSHLAFVPRINLLLGPGSTVGTMNISLLLIPFIIQFFATGMDPPRRELASLGHKSSIDNRDEISDFPSSSRMVELSPVDQVSVDMSPSNDVSTYGTMIRKHNSPYQIPTPDERAMIAGRDARADSVSPNVAITRTHAGPGYQTTTTRGLRCGL